MTSTCGNLSYNLTSNLCGSPFIWPNIHGSWWHSNTHRIHGTGIFTYIYLPKINHSWIGKYTIRPMDPSWDIHGNAKPKPVRPDSWGYLGVRSPYSTTWMFPKIGVGPQNGWFINYKSSILGYPYFWKHSGSGVNGKPYQNGWFGGFSHYFWFNTHLVLSVGCDVMIQPAWNTQICFSLFWWLKYSFLCMRTSNCWHPSL